LGVGAWRALAELEAHAGRRSEASDARARAGALAARLETTYGWSEESYLADSIRGGVPVRQLRPNALLAVSAGLLTPELARRMVHRAAQPDLSTPWGVRTLSSRDAEYDPLAYHGGQVWPLATGWAAEAAFAAGEEELALGYLERLAQTLIEERGYANECYRGDRSEPWNSCFLLGFSVAPFLTVLFERLWGVRPRLGEGRVELAPQLPRRWEHGALRGIRLGGGRLDLEFDARRYRASYAGTAPLTLVGPGGERSATGPSVSLELLRSR
jgi:glycogen debranching enzyme